MKDLNMEMAKIQATLNNLIEGIHRQAEGKCTIDTLGSLYALSDQINALDAIIDKIAQ